MLETIQRTVQSGMRTYAMLLMLALVAASAQGAHIVRIAGQDPSALATPDTEVKGHDGQVVKRREILRSADAAFEAGIASMQVYHEAVESHPVDEFIFALEGQAKLTSADGSVLEVVTGDAIFIPRGWQGKWETQGFREVFVRYESKTSPTTIKEHAAEARYPRKISSTDNLALTTADVKAHDVFRYRVLGKSADEDFRAGFTAMKATRSLQTGSDVDEVLIMLEGSETFTSPDGSIVKTVPGDVVFMPKGWKGHYSTEGYQEIYVIYGPECMAQNNC